MDQGPSRTAVLVCQGRAVAHGRLAVGRFDDPTAIALLDADEREPVEQARTGRPPAGWADRMEYEMLAANAEVMAPRTVAIDDAVGAAANPQVVILGAGLDGRAWRLAALAGRRVVEVDHPASQDDKRRRVSAAGLGPPAGSLAYAPVDFARDDLGTALDRAGHDAAAATTWVWEGVVAYLRAPEVEATADVVAARSAPGSRLVLNYQAPSLAAAAGLVASRALARVGRRQAPTAGEPRRSTWTPSAVRSLAAGRGYAIGRDDDLATVAKALGMRPGHARTLRAGRVAVADRA
jgi:methyltransferase (TIGR00027 family)